MHWSQSRVGTMTTVGTGARVATMTPTMHGVVHWCLYNEVWKPEVRDSLIKVMHQDYYLKGPCTQLAYTLAS